MRGDLETVQTVVSIVFILSPHPLLLLPLLVPLALLRPPLSVELGRVRVESDLGVPPRLAYGDPTVIDCTHLVAPIPSLEYYM